ncbi:MAG: hypothetical protein ACT4P4_23780 [Betaproteobacteria bacterium]
MSFYRVTRTLFARTLCVLGLLLLAKLAYAGECDVSYQPEPCLAGIQCPVLAASPVAPPSFDPRAGANAPLSGRSHALPFHQAQAWIAPDPPARYPFHILFRRYLS